MHVLAAACCILLSSLFAVAQDGAALAAREQKFVAKVVPALHALADALAGQKQHLRALELRRSIWLDYDEHDVKAREKCGFVKVGDLWRKDDSRLVLDKDLKGDAKALKKVEQDWQALKKELVAEHRALAAGYQKADDVDRALRHWRRLLQLMPGDKEAATELALQPFEGFRGSPTEVGMLRRGRTIRSACDWLRRSQPAIEDLGSAKHPLLERAKVPHIGVRSEHYVVWGNLSPEELTTIAMDCERAMLLALTMFGTWRGAPTTPAVHRDMVFVRDPAQYVAILRQCADQFDAARLAFLENEVHQAFLSHGDQLLRVHKAVLGLDAARDQAVRGIVQDVLGLRAEGLVEGIGHAACGFLLGRTLTFLVEQQKAQTVASWQPRTLAPDLAVWQQIAEESAWAKSDTRTSELVLLSAARFTTEQRVKAWAMCHYLVHWRPDLLHELDQSQNKDIRTPPDVEAAFQKRTALDLAKVDHDWREFWGRGAELRKAMAADPIPDEKSPERPARLRARSVVDAVNAARAAALRGPAGFFVASGPDVLAAMQYDEQLGKAEAEAIKKPKEAPPLPVAPAAIGRTVLWSRLKDPSAAVADWLVRPVWRDALVHPGRELFGGATYGNACVLDLAVPAMATKRGLPQCWPRQGQRAVPASAVVAGLGPRAVAALAGSGKKPADTVGMPVSLHFARAIDPAELGKVGCRVWVGNHEIPGAMVVYGGGAEDGDQADGLVAFVPLVPLPAKERVEVIWELPGGYLGKDERFPTVAFSVQ